MMIIKYLCFAFVLFCAACTFAEEPVPLADKLVSCGNCHVGTLALTGKPAEKLLSEMRRIRDRKRAHPPGLQVFESDQLAEIATILSGVSSAESPH